MKIMEGIGDVEVLLSFMNSRWICGYSVLHLADCDWQRNKTNIEEETIGQILERDIFGMAKRAWYSFVMVKGKGRFQLSGFQNYPIFRVKV